MGFDFPVPHVVCSDGDRPDCQLIKVALRRVTVSRADSGLVLHEATFAEFISTQKSQKPKGRVLNDAVAENAHLQCSNPKIHCLTALIPGAKVGGCIRGCFR